MTNAINPIVRVYEGNKVSFAKSDNVMINATEMAKPFGKSTKDWMVNKSTTEFLNELSSVRGIPLSQLVVVKKGNSSQFDQGTWMHEDVALEFARWLSPKFAIWCNDQIKELLTTGTVSLPQDYVSALRALADAEEKKILEKQRADKAEKQLTVLAAEVETMKPKVSYLDTILNSKGTVTITQIAQDYGYSAKAFNSKLAALRIQHKVGGQWILYAPYLTQGYVHSKSVPITHNSGRTEIKLNTEWTQKGRLFLYDELKSHNILPIIEQ